MAEAAPEAGDLVLAHVCYSHSRAEVIVSLLQAYGIPAILPERHFNSVYGHLVLATGGFRILVPSQDLRDARELLKPFNDADDQPESEAFRKDQPSGVLWILLSLLTGTYAPGWLVNRDR